MKEDDELYSNASDDGCKGCEGCNGNCGGQAPKEHLDDAMLPESWAGLQTKIGSEGIRVADVVGTFMRILCRDEGWPIDLLVDRIKELLGPDCFDLQVWQWADILIEKGLLEGEEGFPIYPALKAAVGPGPMLKKSDDDKK